MMLIRNVLLSLLVTSIACASVPDELMMNNKPIDALCFFNMENTGGTINLKRCGLAKQKNTLRGHNTKLSKQGFIGYDIQSPAPSGRAQGYSYYKFYNAGNHQYWIYAVNNGGGSGDFTSIQLVKRKNPTKLITKGIAGGDRCNGGVRVVSESNKQLTYSTNLTAYDFITFSKQTTSSSKAYDDLAACAVCCVAKAVYKTNANSQPQLQYIDLGHIQNVSNLPQQGTSQACFNKLFVSYVNAGETKLQESKLDEFIKKFNHVCLKK